MQPYGMNTRSGIGSWRAQRTADTAAVGIARRPADFRRLAGVLVFSLICGAALRTVTADFKPGDDNVEAAIPLNLAL